MNELMNLEQTMNSVQLVEVINEYRKVEGNESVLQHSHFLQKIEKELNGDEAIFRSTYLDNSNRQSKCYNLPKDECMLMLMSESRIVRKGVLTRLNELENKRTPSYQIEDKIARAEAWLIEQKKARFELEEANKTKDLILVNNKCYDVSVVAKECNFRSAQAFNTMLKNDGYIFKQNGFWKEYADKVYLKFFRHGSVVTPAGTMTILQITEKGRIHFTDIFKNN